MVYGGHCAYNLLGNLISNFVRVKFGQIVGKNCGSLICNGVFVDSSNGNLFAYAVSHLFVVGLVAAVHESFAEFFGNGVCDILVIEFFGNNLGKRIAAFVVDENFKIFRFERTNFKRDCVCKLVFVYVVFNLSGSRRKHCGIARFGQYDFLGNLFGK